MGRSFLAVAVFSGFLNLLMLVPAFYMLQVYDRVVMNHSISTLIALSAIAAILFIFMGGFDWIRNTLLLRASHRISQRLGSRVFAITFRKYLSSNSVAEAGQPLQDLSGLRQFLANPAVGALFDAPWVPLYLLVMFLMHPALGWFALCALILLVILSMLNEWSSRRVQKEANVNGMRAAAYNQACLRNAEAIVAMGMTDTITNRWQAHVDRAAYSQYVSSRRGNVFAALTKSLRFALQSGILGLGAYLVIQQDLTPALMIGGSLLLGRALAPVDQLIGAWRLFFNAREQFTRLSNALHDFPIDDKRMTLPTLAGAVEAQRVIVHAHSSGNPIIKAVSFTLKPGESAALIGPSGAGKSTLVKAMLGLIPLSSGEVRLDGASISQLHEHDRQYLGYLPQDVELFDGTVAQNISRFQDVNEESIYRAAQLVGLHRFILNLPDGYNTQIGHGGCMLSGGQRQLIGLARAVFGEPKFIVLDEPDASLDDSGEKALIGALQKLKDASVTVLIISHKNLILKAVDSVLVMNSGAITLGGPRDQVLARLNGTRNSSATPPKAVSPQEA
ncbi:type I secretion system permease/ATPase [Pseudoalteromonas luteoviolacea]|uniref:type I secretion system permease/ATPase n=1 Tax=Pseudoalteromonas luteoviolacea TaxID=43657 RepID=UPI0007B0933B|nr:type I secretion system permease/ATPase [Pseudoalteromonas luteoviolacea]